MWVTSGAVGYGAVPMTWSLTSLHSTALGHVLVSFPSLLFGMTPNTNSSGTMGSTAPGNLVAHPSLDLEPEHLSQGCSCIHLQRAATTHPQFSGCCWHYLMVHGMSTDAGCSPPNWAELAETPAASLGLNKTAPAWHSLCP